MNVQDSTTSAQPFIRRNSTETSLVNALSRLHLSEGGHQNSLRQSTSGGQAHQKTPQNAESDSPKTQAFSTLSKEKSGEEGKNHKEDGAEALVSNPTHPLRRDGGDRTEQLKLPEQEREPSRSLSRVEQIPRCSPFAWCTSAGQDARRTVDQGISSLFQAESGLLSVGARPHVSRPPPLFQFSLVPHPEVLGEFSVAAGDDVHHHLLRAGLGSPSCPNPSTPLQHSRADNEFSRYLQLLSAENPHTAGNRLGVRDNSSLAVQQFSAAAPSSPLLARRGLRCSPRNTLLIFDWDDTLFPSSWLRCAGIDPLNPLQFGTFSELPSHVQEALTVCEDRVLQVLEAAHELGMVMVVSNAHTRWLRLSLEKLMPRVGVLMRQREVAVVSARCVCEAVGCPDASLWKTATFDALIDAFMRTHAAEVARHRQLDQNSTLLPRGRTVRNMIEGGYPQSANTVGALRIPRYLTNSGTRTAAAMMALEDRDAGGGAEETARLSAGTSTTDQRADSGCHVSTLAQLGFGGQAVQSRTVSDGGCEARRGTRLSFRQDDTLSKAEAKAQPTGIQKMNFHDSECVNRLGLYSTAQSGEERE
ncbi:hypothetical protein NCLIV_005840 [Neospora caninum Liverpool]|uniref:Uncharacterized protein n=1 Tax=Neospora caninum (strain Liverpool) TaxID=572307 RepID=F0V8R7_NEOCL|nr:hypothetical protein NCLIV_005840 [Neospora caninum Liverpool]CBZ50108.1 hypothetical protein NCLIV_005840 [Neospora caninum Liverpool]|eukprot:XP_003880143.1 hypothetical protein NCLIV_005840 [Neospora caninum Liverpool]